MYNENKPMYLKDLTTDELMLIAKYRLGDEETRCKITEAVFSNDEQTLLRLIAKTNNK